MVGCVLKIPQDSHSYTESVRERYRDLLQASTSIISIAESSRHVTEALAEIRGTMMPDQHWKPRSSSVRGKDGMQSWLLI